MQHSWRRLRGWRQKVTYPGFRTDLVGEAGSRTVWDVKAARKILISAVQPVTSLASVSRDEWFAVVTISDKYVNKNHSVGPIL